MVGELLVIAIASAVISIVILRVPDVGEIFVRAAFTAPGKIAVCVRQSLADNIGAACPAVEEIPVAGKIRGIDCACRGVGVVPVSTVVNGVCQADYCDSCLRELVDLA